jgi:hypothetical protein
MSKHCASGKRQLKTVFAITLLALLTGSLKNIAAQQKNELPPAVSIGNTTVIEGTGGELTQAVFPITLDRPSHRAIVVKYYTSDISAFSLLDYSLEEGVVVFRSGETAKTISIGVVPDNLFEGEEVFQLSVSAVHGARILSPFGLCSIIDDDGESGS